jgi:hypothetical protein
MRFDWLKLFQWQAQSFVFLSDYLVFSLSSTMSDQVGDDGFVKVERFKYKPINNNKKKNKKNNKYTFKDSDDWTLDDMTNTLKQRK